MAKLVMRISIILLLVLSIAALIFGMQLFRQRETLKGRTLKLEEAVKQVATTLEVGDNSDVKVALADTQLKTFKSIPGGPPNMDVPLGILTKAAKTQLTRLNVIRSTLSDTQFTLTNTEERLRVTLTTLATAERDVKDLTAKVTARDQTLSEKEVAIKTLEREKTDWVVITNTLTEKVLTLETEKQHVIDQVNTLTQKVAELEIQLAPIQKKNELAKGRLGEIMYVNLEWNFAVIRISSGSRKNIDPDMELLIQRADRLVGKIKIVNIIDDVAVGEIQNDWSQFPMQKGDWAIYGE